MTRSIIVIAKAPVPGLAKTRIGAELGDETAAALAASALLDTMDAVESATAAGRRALSLDGDLGRAVDGELIDARLASWHVFRQPCGTLGARLAGAFASATRLWGRRPAALVGMDTPQIGRRDLEALFDGFDARRRRQAGANLGPADDGGWWGLGLSDPSLGRALVDVPTSTSRTCARTQDALQEAGAAVRLLHRLRDMDTLDDALVVAADAPGSRVAATLGQLTAGIAR